MLTLTIKETGNAIHNGNLKHMYVKIPQNK